MVQKLKSEKLVIPYEVYAFYDIEIAFNPAKENDFSKLNQDYNFDYQVLKSKEVSDKILKGEEFYFIRYTLIETEKINFKDLGQPLRIILTGSEYGPAIYDIASSLGLNEFINRLELFITKIDKNIKN